MDKLLKEIQELNKVDSALESSLILKRKHLENELLKKKVNKYKEVIDKAIEYISELDDNTDDTTCYDIDKDTRDYILSILKEVE